MTLDGPCVAGANLVADGVVGVVGGCNRGVAAASRGAVVRPVSFISSLLLLVFYITITIIFIYEAASERRGNNFKGFTRKPRP